MGPALVLLAAAVVLAGWVFTNPVGGSPDELNHVLRAEAVGRGDLAGRPNPELEAHGADERVVKSCCETDNPARLRWVRRGARMVKVPAALDFGACFDESAGYVARCVADGRGPVPAERLTTMGTLEPVPYLVPGVATRFADTPVAAVRWARAANALVTLVLLALAAWVLRSPGGPLAWLGLLAAVSPMVLFVGASPAPSALEVSGGICFAAGLIRLARAPDQAATASVWATLAVGGMALAASRSLGPVWVVFDVAAVTALVGPGRFWRTARAGGAWAVGAVVAVVAAGAATAGWELTHQPGVPFDGGFFLNQLGPSIADLPRVQQELVGVFGSVDVPLPGPARWAWTAMLLGLVVTAFTLGSRRQRTVLAAAAVGVVVVTVLVSSAFLRQNGFQVQGRHVLAFAVLLPLLAGEVVHTRRRRLPRRLSSEVLIGGAVALAVVIHLVGLDASLRHFTGPDHAPAVLLVPWWIEVLAGAAIGGAWLWRRQMSSRPAIRRSP